MKLRKKLYKAGEKAISILKYASTQRKVDLAYDTRINTLEMEKAELIDNLSGYQIRVAKGETSCIMAEVEAIEKLKAIDDQIAVLRERKGLLDKEAPKDDKELDEEDE